MISKPSIAYTMSGAKDYAREKCDLGVKAFMLISNGLHELEKVNTDVLMGKPFLPESIPQKMAPLPFN